MTKKEAFEIVRTINPESIEGLTIRECDAMHIAIQSLQNEILRKESQGLDKAAEEYAKNEAYGMNDDLIRICNDAFKAGAKRMAEQGVSFSYEVFLDDDYKLPYIELDTGSVQGTQWLDKHEYKKGNKVIVQIRKAD